MNERENRGWSARQEGLFQRLTCLLLALCLMVSVFPLASFAYTPSEKVPFKDVGEGSWYEDDIAYVYENGLFTGTGEDSFTPNGKMTRGMFVTILARMAGVDADEYDGQSGFADVGETAYYAPYVIWAAENSITLGVGGGNFDPDGTVDRQQMAVFYVRLLDLTGTPFREEDPNSVPADLDRIASWAKEAAVDLWQAGLLNGDGTNFNPTQAATRAQAAALTARVVRQTGFFAGGTEEIPEAPTLPGSTIETVVTGGGTSHTRYYQVTFALGETEEDCSGVSMPDSQSVKDGTAISALATPNRRGYVFLGWYYDKALTERVETGDTVTKDLTLYASLTTLDQEFTQDTPSYCTQTDVGTDFTFQVKAQSLEQVQLDLTVTQITANNAVLSGLTIVSTGDGLYTVSYGYEAGHTYRARLDEDSAAVFVVNGVEQGVWVRDLNFITYKAETLQLSLANGIVYLPKGKITSMSDSLQGLFTVAMSGDSVEETVIQTVDQTGTFTYSGNETIRVGDTVAIYEGTRPDTRTLHTDNDGNVAYVTITAVSGTTYTYGTADAADVLFTPDVLPIPADADQDPDDGNLLTLVAADLDFSDDRYSAMGLDSTATADEGDYIALYTGAWGMGETAPTYGKITKVTQSGDTYTIFYTGATEDEVYASMDICTSQNQDIPLTEKEKTEIEESVVAQAEESGFVEEAADYLMALLMETGNMSDLPDSVSVDLTDEDYQALQLMGKSSKAKVETKVRAYVRNKLTHFSTMEGLRIELTIECEITFGDDKENQFKIVINGEFAQEVVLNMNISGGAIWKKAWIFPYIYDYRLNASIDVGTYTSVAFAVTMKTNHEDKDDDKKDDDDDKKNFLDIDWSSVFNPGDDVTTDDYFKNFGEQLDKYIEEREAFYGEEEDDEVDSDLSGLMSAYAEMIDDTDDGWLELVRKKIFKLEGHFDPFGIVAYGFGADFVIKANVYITIGMTFEYANAKRYNYSLMLFHRQTTNETIDLETENYEFTFYVMGTMGIRMGIEFEFAIGLISLKLDSIGITAEVGVYAQLWGYFYYKLTWNANDGKDEFMAGALLLEVGAYLEIKFKAQLFSSDKLTYNPTIYAATWPFWSLGSRENVYAFNWEKGDEDDDDAKGPTYEFQTVTFLTLPSSLFDMAYMDMQTGKLFGKDNDEDPLEDDWWRLGNYPAKNYDDATESHYRILLSNDAFSYDPATNTVTVTPPDGSVEETCEMTLIWKDGTVAFSSKPIQLVVTLNWSDPVGARYLAFDSQGGSNVKMITAAPGAAITSPEPPTKTGYTFAGWYTDADCTTAYEIPAVMPEFDPENDGKGITLYAKWAPDPDTRYTVEYYVQELNGSYTLDDGGDYVTCSRLDTGTTDAQVAPNVTPPTGFSLNEKKSTLDQTISPNGSTVVKVYFSRNTHTLTYTYGDQKSADNTDLVYQCKYGAELYAPVLHLGGYTFAGWNETVAATMPDHDVTYGAAWTPSADTAFRVEYYVQDITEDKWYYQGAESGTGTTNSVPDLTGFEYTMDGISLTLSRTTVGGTAVTDENRSTLLKISGDGSLVVKLYYDRTACTVTFDSLGGSDVASQTVRSGGKASYPKAPTRQGYTFSHWCIHPDCSNGASCDSGWNFSTVIPKVGGITLYAVWTANSDTAYRVEHYRQDITGDGYTLADTEQKTGTTGAPTEAKAKAYEGFQAAKAFDQTVIAADGTTVVKLYYDRKTYSVTFYTAGGSQIPATQTVRHGGTITEPANPTKTGYLFNGWSTGIKTWNFETTVTGDVSLTAIWAPASGTAYTVAFYEMDVSGSYPEEATKTESLTGTTDSIVNAIYTEPEGFSLDRGRSVRSGSVAPDGSLVLQIYFSRNRYQLTFDANGGVDSKVSTLYYGETISVPTVTRTGYTFDGWGSDVAGTMPDADTTYTAQWQGYSYTVKFDANLPTGITADPGTMANQTGFVYGTATALNKANYALPGSGYTFVGWSTEQDASSAIFQDGAAFNWLPDSDGGTITLYAVWQQGEAATYTVQHSFMDLDGTTYTVDDSKTDTLTSVAGATTAAIAKDVAGFTAQNVTQQTIAASGTTVTIFYDRNQYQLTWNLDNGTASNSYTAGILYYGAAITRPIVTRTGHTLLGWSVNGEVVSDDTIATTMPAKDLAYTASWSQNSHTLTVNNGDSTPQSVERSYGETVSLHAGTRTGYTFMNWTVESGNVTLDNAAAAQTSFTMPDGDVTITANWTPNQYTVRFDANSGTGSMADIFCIYDREETLTENNFTYAGHQFCGWNTMENGTGTGYSDGASVTNLTAEAEGTVTLYAQWDTNRYTVIVDSGTPTSHRYGETVTLTPPTGREGHTFTGWTADPDTLDITDNTFTMPAEDVTITSNWTVNQYTITFHTNGGGSVETIRQDYGTAITLPVPTRIGYGFDGWYTDQSFQTQFTGSTMPAGSMTLYAKWTEGSYSITYDLDGGTISGQRNSYGVTDSFALPQPTKTGYTFSGWTGSNGTTPQTTVTVSQGTTGDLGYTANWTANAYTIYFDGNGKGSGSMDSIVCRYDEEVTLPACSFQSNTHTFSGWSTSQSGGTIYAAGTAVSNLTAAQNGAVTLYAQWDVTTYTVTFQDYDGTALKTAKVEAHTGSVAAPDAPSRTGYTFTGWNRNYSNTGETVFDSFSSDTIIIARYTPNSYDYALTSDCDVRIGEEAFGSAVISGVTGGKLTYDQEYTIETTSASGFAYAGFTLNGTSYGSDRTTFTAGATNELVVHFTRTATYTADISYYRVKCGEKVGTSISRSVLMQVTWSDGTVSEKTLNTSTSWQYFEPTSCLAYPTKVYYKGKGGDFNRSFNYSVYVYDLAGNSKKIKDDSTHWVAAPTYTWDISGISTKIGDAIPSIYLSKTGTAKLQLTTYDMNGGAISGVTYTVSGSDAASVTADGIIEIEGSQLTAETTITVTGIVGSNSGTVATFTCKPAN